MRPEPRLIAILAIVTAAALIAVFWRPLLPVVLVVLGVSVLVCAVDAGRGRRWPTLTLRRIVSHALALGVWTDVRLELSHESPRDIDVEIYDHHPATGETRGLPRRELVQPGKILLVTYRFRAHRRGGDRFAPAELLVRSPWGLWRLRHRAGEPSEVKVFPDFRSVQRYAILAAENARGPVGIRKRPKRGEGLELHQLREYRDGDALRQIDWKATSRLRRLISRQYEDERNQQVVFLLDCGWRMRAVDDGEAHFDRALNSVLLLTYVAVRQGDAVGLMTLGGEDRWLPPQRGPAAMRAMLEAVYDVETRTTHPDFIRGATRLMARQRRRALIVILSNLREEDSDEAAAAARLLRRRHLVLFASLREASLDAAVDGPVESFDSALRVAATHHFLHERRRAHERLMARGVSTIDVTPAGLPAAIVNRYLDFKRSGVL